MIRNTDHYDSRILHVIRFENAHRAGLPLPVCYWYACRWRTAASFPPPPPIYQQDLYLNVSGPGNPNLKQKPLKIKAEFPFIDACIFIVNITLVVMVNWIMLFTWRVSYPAEMNLQQPTFGPFPEIINAFPAHEDILVQVNVFKHEFQSAVVKLFHYINHLAVNDHFPVDAEKW